MDLGPSRWAAGGRHLTEYQLPIGVRPTAPAGRPRTARLPYRYAPARLPPRTRRRATAFLRLRAGAARPGAPARTSWSMPSTASRQPKPRAPGIRTSRLRPGCAPRPPPPPHGRAPASTRRRGGRAAAGQRGLRVPHPPGRDLTDARDRRRVPTERFRGPCDRGPCGRMRAWTIPRASPVRGRCRQWRLRHRTGPVRRRSAECTGARGGGGTVLGPLPARNRAPVRHPFVPRPRGGTPATRCAHSNCCAATTTGGGRSTGGLGPSATAPSTATSGSAR